MYLELYILYRTSLNFFHVSIFPAVHRVRTFTMDIAVGDFPAESFE